MCWWAKSPDQLCRTCWEGGACFTSIKGPTLRTTTPNLPVGLEYDPYLDENSILWWSRRTRHHASASSRARTRVGAHDRKQVLRTSVSGGGTKTPRQEDREL